MRRELNCRQISYNIIVKKNENPLTFKQVIAMEQVVPFFSGPPCIGYAWRALLNAYYVFFLHEALPSGFGLNW